MTVEGTEASTAIAVEIKPHEPDAGAEVALTATLPRLTELDVPGRVVRLTDATGAVLAEAGIEVLDDENCGATLTAKAPPTTGTHDWSVVVPAHKDGEAEYPEISQAVALTVRPHATTIVVWDTPPAIVAGERFRFKVGIKCSSSCGPEGWRFEVAAEDGVLIADGRLGTEPAPGTAALYFAEVEALAPAAIGLHRWTARAFAEEHILPHDNHAVQFGIHSVAKPECEIAIEAIDAETQQPVKGAKVVVHPHRTFTDESGRARLRIPKGTYSIYVSGHKYVPFRTDNEVTGDISVRAELVEDRGLSIADIWA